MDNKLKELKEVMEQRYKREFTEEQVKFHCVSIVHNGVFIKNWSFNGVKVAELD